MYIYPLHSYHASGDIKALEKCENEINSCQRKTHELTQKNFTMQKRISELQEQIVNAEVIYKFIANYCQE